MIRVVIYFHGPKTAWSKKIDEGEIVAERTLYFRWFARLWAKSIVDQLTAHRCGYTLLDDGGDELEHVPASNQVL